MSTLEDLMPEMAGIFAAQESALENCVRVLTTQLQNLGVDCSRQLRRVASLEASHRSLLDTISGLHHTIENLTQQNQQLIAQQVAQLDEIAALRDKTPTIDLDGLKEQLQSHISLAVDQQLQAMDDKVTQQMNERLLETSNRAFLRAQQSEETMQSQLEMLEKKFEYLSKIKMEIKDLGKRMDKQDQTVDDMRTGLALLAKSVGSDEIDDDEEADGDVTDSSRRKPSATADVPMVVKPTLVSLELSIEEEEPTEITVEPPVTEPQPFLPLAVEETAPLDIGIDSTIEETGITVDSVEDDHEQLILPNPEIEKTPDSEGAEDLKEETESEPSVEVSSVEEARLQQQPEDTTTAVSPRDEPEVVRTTTHPESETPPPSDSVESTPRGSDQTIIEVEHAPAVEEITPQPAEQGSLSEPAQEEQPQPPSEPPVLFEHPNTARAYESGDETEDDDRFQASNDVPVSATFGFHRPSQPHLQHMLTAPSLSTVALIRSRRQERTAKKLGRRESTMYAAGSDTRAQHIPLTHDEIRTMWIRIFNKIVQLKRIQSINGSSPERTLFRKQNISMGARVKRLEETTTDLEDTIEFLETNLHNAGQTLQALDQAVAQSSTALDKKTKKLDEVQKMQAQSIVGIEEKFEAFEAEFRRLRNVARRDSAQNSMTASAFTQIASQMQDVTSQLGNHERHVETHEKILQQLVHTDLPSLKSSVQSTILELRAEVDFKTRELSKSVMKSVDQLRTDQAADHRKLETQLDGSVEALYRDLLVLTSSILVAVELAAKQTSSKSVGSPTKKSNQKSPLDVSVAMLQSVIATFETECRKMIATNEDSNSEISETSALIAVVFSKLQQFRYDLVKLKEQADKASSIIGTSDTDSGSKIRSFEGHLVLICTNQLRTFEELLVAQSGQSSSTSASDTSDESNHVIAHVKDLVIQLRAVLFLLVLYTQLIESPQQIDILQVAQSNMETKLTSHDFALSQLATVEAVVKLMNNRLDSFMDMSFSFAKDADVKKSIQDILNTSDEFRDQLTKHLDSTNADSVKRDELIEREVSQLAGRVQKKLDKDELLWTQEVLERQLNNVAKGALGEQDLVDIQRALRAKMDKTHFHALLQQQHAKLQELGMGNGALSLYGGSGSGGNQPLIASRCISCDGELPPSASQMRAAVREEVQLEVAKALATAKHYSHALPQSSSTASSSSPSFNASSHRSMDKHKKELLMAALKK